MKEFQRTLESFIMLGLLKLFVDVFELFNKVDKERELLE